jgi:hypothetical protein
MTDYAVTRIRWNDADHPEVVEVEEGEVVESGTFPDDVMRDLREVGAISKIPTGTEADLGLIVASKDAEIIALKAKIEELRDKPDQELPKEEVPPTNDELADGLQDQLDAKTPEDDKGPSKPSATPAKATATTEKK